MLIDQPTTYGGGTIVFGGHSTGGVFVGADQTPRLREELIRETARADFLQAEKDSILQQALIDHRVIQLKRRLKQDHVEMRAARKHGFLPLTELSQPAVYLLMSGSVIVYVGQSKTPYSRIYQHRDKKFEYVRFLFCKKERLTYWEKILIKRYQPQYNGTHKS